jgi:hypothetical protein
VILRPVLSFTFPCCLDHGHSDVKLLDSYENDSALFLTDELAKLGVTHTTSGSYALPFTIVGPRC